MVLARSRASTSIACQVSGSKPISRRLDAMATTDERAGNCPKPGYLIASRFGAPHMNLHLPACAFALTLAALTLAAPPASAGGCSQLAGTGDGPN
jgi:hypothetical protein